MAAHTSRVGLVSTASTSYQQPYHVARMFASLDHISGGRAGWNVVTSVNEAEGLNFGKAGHYGHDERSARADEFVAVRSEEHTSALQSLMRLTSAVFCFK